MPAATRDATIIWQPYAVEMSTDKQKYPVQTVPSKTVPGLKDDASGCWTDSLGGTVAVVTLQGIVTLEPNGPSAQSP